MRASGHTLIELLIVLCVLAGLLAFTLPDAARWRDQAAVRAARDELAAALEWTRVAASARDGATLVLDPATARFWTDHPGRTAVVDLGRYRVSIDAGTTGLVRFDFDALGFGRVASRTIRIRRQEALGGLTVSAYGRIRRW